MLESEDIALEGSTSPSYPLISSGSPQAHLTGIVSEIDCQNTKFMPFSLGSIPTGRQDSDAIRDISTPEDTFLHSCCTVEAQARHCLQSDPYHGMEPDTRPDRPDHLLACLDQADDRPSDPWDAPSPWATFPDEVTDPQPAPPEADAGAPGTCYAPRGGPPAGGAWDLGARLEAWCAGHGAAEAWGDPWRLAAAF